MKVPSNLTQLINRYWSNSLRGCQQNRDSCLWQETECFLLTVCERTYGGQLLKQHDRVSLGSVDRVHTKY